MILLLSFRLSGTGFWSPKVGLGLSIGGARSVAPPRRMRRSWRKDRSLDGGALKHDKHQDAVQLWSSAPLLAGPFAGGIFH